MTTLDINLKLIIIKLFKNIYHFQLLCQITINKETRSYEILSYNEALHVQIILCAADNGHDKWIYMETTMIDKCIDGHVKTMIDITALSRCLIVGN